MKKMDLKRRLLAFMTTMVMIGSEIGSSGMTLYAAGPEESGAVSEDEVQADEETETVSADSVSEDEAEDIKVSETEEPDADESGEEAIDSDDDDEEFTEIGSYRFGLSDGEESMINIIRNTGGEDEDTAEEDDVKDISYKDTIFASDLSYGQELKLNANTRLEMDVDLTLSKIEGKEYSLMVEGTNKLTVFGKGNAVYVDNLIIKTDMAVSTSTNGKFSLITDGFISVIRCIAIQRTARIIQRSSSC